MRRIYSASLLVAVLASAPGCFWVTTKSEGKALRRDVDSLDGRVATKENDIDAKVEELRKVLDEATKLLKRNSADVGADVQAMSDEIRTMRGLLNAAKNMVDEVAANVDKLRTEQTARLDGLEQRIATLESRLVGGGGTGPVTSNNPEELWTSGRTAFEAGDYDKAQEAFKKLAVSFPSHDRADDAQYFRGEAYFNKKDFDGAIREYQKVLDKYADSSFADDALFRAGEAAQALKNCTEARAYFGLLKQKYPKSNLVKKAGDKDKELKAALKNKAKCSS
jgi:tol-pal system protein YbgF